MAAAIVTFGVAAVVASTGAVKSNHLARTTTASPRPAEATVTVSTTTIAPTTTTTATPPPPTAPPTTASQGPYGPVALAGCPPPPHPPRPAPPRWHPDVLVPESSLPDPPPPAPRARDLRPVGGKGMWIWMPERTEGGDVTAIVRRAEQAHLTELWVRIGDSRNGFYGSSFLNALVPVAHKHGLAVIGWGFPYLYDPAGDAQWTAASMDWRSPGGDGLDGFSGDIETGSEGTALSARRAAVYLGLSRPHAAGRPLVATVFPPNDHWANVYPYSAMAPYVDTFAAMVYWGCREPGEAAAEAIGRLRPLAPVHVIGQAYDMAPEGGRIGAPAGPEISRFLDVARRGGAAGASFWDWQEMTADEWASMIAYRWR